MANAVFYLIEPASITYTGSANASASITANGSIQFSECSELRLDGVFSADYDNYTVVWNGYALANINIYLRFRQSGFDNPNNTHVSQGLYSSGTVVSADRRTSTNGYFMFSGINRNGGSVGEIYGPYLAQPTALRSVTVSSEAEVRTMDAASTESSSTQWDGFGLFTSSSNFSGRVAVYGMRK